MDELVEFFNHSFDRDRVGSGRGRVRAYGSTRNGQESVGEYVGCCEFHPWRYLCVGRASTRGLVVACLCHPHDLAGRDTHEAERVRSVIEFTLEADHIAILAEDRSSFRPS